MKNTTSIDISHENQPESKINKEIEYAEFLTDKNISKELLESDSIKKSFKNLEDHLLEFCNNKSSGANTPFKEEQKLEISPEAYPDKEEISGLDKTAEDGKSFEYQFKDDDQEEKLEKWYVLSLILMNHQNSYFNTFIP